LILHFLTLLQGYLEYYFGKADRSHPVVVTVFSAPNYCDMYGNDAAVMCIKEDRYEYMVTKSVEHPYYLPDLTNAIHYTFPFIMENLSELMYGAVMFFVAPREDDSEPEPVTKESNTKTLMRLDRYFMELFSNFFYCLFNIFLQSAFNEAQQYECSNE
jgi:hypothetical protein